MEKIFDWITKHKKTTIVLLMLIIILPIVIIHILFKWKSNCYWIEAEWNAGDVLGYFGDVLSFVGTVVLGYIAVKQTERANKLNKELLLIEKNKIKPVFNIVQDELYKIFIDAAMQEEISKIKENDLSLNILYPYMPRTGMETSSALIKLKVKNTGGTTISRMYIKTKLFYLSVTDPNNTTEEKLSYFTGNTRLGAGEEKSLYIIIKREFQTNNKCNSNYYEKNIDRLMPHAEFELTLETVIGQKYKENISFGSNWNINMVSENNITTRGVGIIDITVDEVNE